MALDAPLPVPQVDWKAQADHSKGQLEACFRVLPVFSASLRSQEESDSELRLRSGRSRLFNRA
jgi:hypothetical protein